MTRVVVALCVVIRYGRSAVRLRTTCRTVPASDSEELLCSAWQFGPVARIEKTVFVSYRRADRWPALAVKDLTQHGYDVFIDYDGIASGDFERAIVDNIRARAHFIVVLTPTALERCDTLA